jgi:hypothetical protein
MYKVQTFEMAEKLSKMDGNDDGKYNGMPIEVAGEGFYSDLVRSGRRSTGGRATVPKLDAWCPGVYCASRGRCFLQYWK